MMKSQLLISLLEDMGEFKTDVSVDDYGKPKDLPKDVYLQHGLRVELKWSMEEDKRSWGIKGMSPVIPDQDITLIFLEATDDEDIEHELVWSIKNATFEFEMGDHKPSSLQILPTSIEIDFNNNSTKIVYSVA